MSGVGHQRVKHRLNSIHIFWQYCIHTLCICISIGLRMATCHFTISTVSSERFLSRVSPLHRLRHRVPRERARNLCVNTPTLLRVVSSFFFFFFFSFSNRTTRTISFAFIPFHHAHRNTYLLARSLPLLC